MAQVQLLDDPRHKNHFHNANLGAGSQTNPLLERRKKEEGRRFFSESFKENPLEEDPILNRPFCIHSISPLAHRQRVKRAEIDKRGGSSENKTNEKRGSSLGPDVQNHGRFLEAAEHIRRGIVADAKRPQGTDEEIRCQVCHFLDWAAKTGSLIPPAQFQALRLVSSTTSEHKVYFDLKTNCAVKVTLPGEFGWVPSLGNGRWNLGIATPLDYLRRWHLFNVVFGDEVRLEGVAISEGPVRVLDNNVEPVSAVVSQHWHQAADLNHPVPSEVEVSELLHGEGFEPLPNTFGGWRRASDGVVMLDAFPDNFIQTKDGVTPIDLPMTQEGGGDWPLTR